MPSISRRHVIKHFERTGCIIPGHANAIAEYRARTTRDNSGDTQ